MTKRLILNEDTTIFNVHALTTEYQNIWGNLIEQQGETDKHPIIVGDAVPHCQKWTDPMGRQTIRT